METSQGRLVDHARAMFDVILRAPCIFFIDAIFNSSRDPEAGWVDTAVQTVLKLLGLLVFSVILVLSQRALFRFYLLFCAVLLASASVLVNYCSTVQIDFYSIHYFTAFGDALPIRNGLSLWLALAFLQLVFGIGYVTLLHIQSTFAGLIILDFLFPVVSLVFELPVDTRLFVAIMSGMVVTLHATVCLTLKLKWFYYSARYIYLLVMHMYRLYGLQILLEETWKRIRFPDVMRVFWLTRLTVQAGVLIFVAKVAKEEDIQNYTVSWDDFWKVVCSLIISGCDSTLTVLGMSAVISSVAHYLGLGILAFIGSTEDEDKRLGFVAPVLFFILALQTGLSGLIPEERLVRLSRNMCLLLTAILHFIHGMTDPVLMSLSASHVSSFRRHFPVLIVSVCLFVFPILLSYVLWHHYELNTWLFAVTAFCVELCLKVMVSLTVYTLFMIDGFYSVLWERLDDYVYYVRSTGNVVEFLFGVIMFGNGAYTMMFESGSKIRACMMCLHAYFNIYLQAKNGWKTFMNRRTAVKKINSLPEIKDDQLSKIDDVCAICYQEFTTSARTTPCRHYFHALCLRKWLYIQDTCPMCHQKVYSDVDARENTVFNNNGFVVPNENQEPFIPANGAAAAGTGIAGVPPANPDAEDLEDNDSIEYDEEDWASRNDRAVLEEEYLNDETDSNGD
ncbi:E3 ubiquitin-protein ligase RNF139 [Protopterus annectens]|uniref:E3 ubiquitin-protein ligase RNF139 n=1 Tax=Protopterus annectens TaxID=7888 RepID=UPI001CF9DFF9|nr:E3 ubiquitin-protein ligase RNF139 [Protopterus annectens]